MSGRAPGAHPAAERVEQLLVRMTLEEKLAQLGSVWLDHEPQEAEDVAPVQGGAAPAGGLAEACRHGLGQLTRFFGTRPVEAAERARELVRVQREVVARSRFGIAALAHEECLTGFATRGATAFPCPLAWGATWDPGLVEEVGAAVGTSMRAVGVHQGLAPVLDVVRDPRWGRVEECLAEDPYLVGVLAGAYVRGLEGTGVVATLKHFAGYSGSVGGRNLAPVHAGPREVAEVFLPPFEMVLRETGARSVMHSYSDVDGVPAAADEQLLTGVLRDRWGFTGTVVADYWGVTMLHTQHRVAADLGQAGAQALRAGVDVELPGASAYAGPLAALVHSGEVAEELVDRALRRVLLQKADLGLLDYDPDAEEAALEARLAAGPLDLDPPGHRDLARRVARASVVLLENAAGLLPLGAHLRTVAVVGPLADTTFGLLGDYSFPNHVERALPGLGIGIDVPVVVDVLRTELAGRQVVHERGCDVRDPDRSGIAAAVAAAARADVVVAVVGDQSGLFGRGTVGEGCDVDRLDLPGAQRDLVEQLLATGTPVALVLVTGRPYALGWASGRAGAVVQAFLPGEEGAHAVAGVLSGRLEPQGRLTVGIPRTPEPQQYTYGAPPLAGPGAVTSLDPRPLYPFGHGLTYTSFAYSDLRLPSSPVPVDGAFEVGCTVTNTGSRPGIEVVQLYGQDEQASVVRPMQLLEWARVGLAPGESARVSFDVPVDRLGFVGRDLRRVVEPGRTALLVGASCEDVRLRGAVDVEGTVRVLGEDRLLRSSARVEPQARAGQRARLEMRADDQAGAAR